jgi:predicted butyrate kinase (DUF1464 family)
MRVAGMDPGTSSLDVLVLDACWVADQERFAPALLRSDPEAPVRWLRDRLPLDLIAGPSGYGLPMVAAGACGERELALMALVRPDERGQAHGVAGFSALQRALAASRLPVVFLPGVIHLPTVPAHRKFNRIDLGTADKLCVAALALALRSAARGVALTEYSGCLVELGSAFSACLVLYAGQLINGRAGTAGPFAHSSCGGWDGEAAYLLGPLAKHDLFSGGLTSAPDPALGRARFREDVRQAVAGLQAVTPFAELVLSGRLLETDAQLASEVEADLSGLAPVVRLASLPGAWVKHAAQGAALLADGLAGGTQTPLVDSLRLRQAAGTVFDGLLHPRVAPLRAAFGV